MKVLVTGAAGYIGSVLVRQLLAQGHEVLGLDLLMYGGESLISVFNHPKFRFFKADICDADALRSVVNEAEAIVHLAAIVGDPACAKNPEAAIRINWEGSKQLLDISHESKSVKRFVFASTCSNYGKMTGEAFIDEDSPLNPVSLYAELKVNFEKYMLNNAYRADFMVTPLRFATVYGLSPRMRFDLTVNEFMKDAAMGRELLIFGEQFWRPYCHVEDLARACITVLNAAPDQVGKNVFNVGSTEENYQKRMLAEEIQKILPEVVVKYVKRNEDPRDYRVSFEKIKSKLGFNITKTVKGGLQEVNTIVKSGIISNPDSEKYRNS